MTIQMNVECLGDICKGCPELNLEINKLSIHAGTEDLYTENLIRCTGYNRCKHIYRMLEKGEEKQHEQAD